MKNLTKEQKKTAVRMICTGVIVLLLGIVIPLTHPPEDPINLFYAPICFGAWGVSWMKWRGLYRKKFPAATYWDLYVPRPVKGENEISLWGCNSLKWFLLLIICCQLEAFIAFNCY